MKIEDDCPKWIQSLHYDYIMSQGISNIIVDEIHLACVMKELELYRNLKASELDAELRTSLVLKLAGVRSILKEIEVSLNSMGTAHNLFIHNKLGRCPTPAQRHIADEIKNRVSQMNKQKKSEGDEVS